MDAHDLAEWEAYEAIDGPAGLPHQDGLVRAMLLASIYPHLKNPPAFKTAIPPWWEQPPDDESAATSGEVPTSEQIAARVAELRAKLLGG